MKKIIALTLCLIFFQNNCTKHIIQVSIPKCGTHLLRKCISLLTGIPMSEGHSPRSSLCHIEPAEFGRETQKAVHLISHFYFKEEFVPFLNNDESAIFFIYRDPRDQLISAFYYWHRVREGRLEEEAKAFIDEGLLSRIRDVNSGYLSKGIHGLYRCYMPWATAPYVRSIRFEDLVGPKGGGDAQAQRTTIKRIADHLGIDISEKRISEIISDLFGGTNTFRKGQIGDWKNHFKEHHKQAFKEVAGQLLIDLGYEQDLNW